MVRWYTVWTRHCENCPWEFAMRTRSKEDAEEVAKETEDTGWQAKIESEEVNA